MNYISMENILNIIMASGSATTKPDPVDPSRMITVPQWTQEENISNILQSNCRNRQSTTGYEISEIDLTSGTIFYNHTSQPVQTTNDRILLSYLNCQNVPTFAAYIDSVIDNISQKYQS